MNKVVHVKTGSRKPSHYTHYNVFKVLQKIFGGYKWKLDKKTILDNFHENTSFLFFEDFNSSIELKEIEEILKKIKNISPDICVVTLPYDPPNFPSIEYLCKDGLIDKVVVFDKRFDKRFDIPMLVSDYIFNENLIPSNKTLKTKGSCYFGNLIERNLPKGVIHVREEELQDLYNIVSCYQCGVVFDNGRDEEGKRTTNYNKAKAVEMLMCGVVPYVAKGIKTINYDKYFRSLNDYDGNCDEESVPIEEIKEINKRVIKRLENFIKQ